MAAVVAVIRLQDALISISSLLQGKLTLIEEEMPSGRHPCGCGS
jgi:hypothetical protein|tara:strand:- start:1041 stop:1172 length:132 start_codon:yes stop_codon:yes gene_type:complete